MTWVWKMILFNNSNNNNNNKIRINQRKNWELSFKKIKNLLHNKYKKITLILIKEITTITITVMILLIWLVSILKGIRLKL